MFKSQKIKFKEKSQILLVISICFLFLAILISKQLAKKEHTQAIVDKVQNKIHQKENELYHELEKLINFHQNNKKLAFYFFVEENQESNNSGIIYLIFEGDSLIYWSDNSVPLSDLISDSQTTIINSGNSWNLKVEKSNNDFRYIVLFTVKHQYSYQNEFLENKFHPSLSLPTNTDFVIDENNKNAIFNNSGNYLFSIKINQTSTLTLSNELILTLFYLISLVFFLVFLSDLYKYFFKKFKKQWLLIIGFIVDLIIIRYLIFYFKLPRILYESKLFSPHYYAFSEWIPSFGDLIVNIVFIFIISLFIFSNLKFDIKITKIKLFRRYIYSLLLFLIVILFFAGLHIVFYSLINDSIISLDLYNIFNLNWLSLISFFILFISQLSFFLISSKIIFFIYKLLGSFKGFLLSFLPALIIYSFLLFNTDTGNLWLILFLLIYILSFGLFFHQKIFKLNFINILFYATLFSIFSAYILQIYNESKEQENRKFLAINLSLEKRDPVAEFLFQKKNQEIEQDNYLKNLVNDYFLDHITEDSISQYISQKYFYDFSRSYNQQVTICDKNDFLFISSAEVETNCWSFFNNLIESYCKVSHDDNLCFLNYGPGDSGYLAILNIEKRNTHDTIKVFVELTPKFFTKDLGLPDLLIDRDVLKEPALGEYSYAIFNNGILIQRVGKYFYNFDINHYSNPVTKISFFNKNNYNHLVYRADDSRILIISKKNKSFFDIIAPFSYFFIFYSLLIFTVIITIRLLGRRFKYHYNFRHRLQFSMTLVLLLTFVVIGIFTLQYISNLNSKKNDDILNEKTHSILNELQNKIIDKDFLTESDEYYLGDLLVTYSNIFYTDINLFSLDGTLLASSRQQIFKEKLISKKMNPQAFMKLSLENYSFYIQNEHIGNQHFLSAYIPFINYQNRVIAYLNLPYFAKEKDLQREISSFIVTYINIYILLIVFSILLAVLISNYISQPIKLIMKKISDIKLSGNNEKIEWKRDDELGQLIASYNSMIDQLAISAELLAQSERESAWREMARQIAHEIKNPLTPMKLTIQHLQHAWNSQAPDWDKRLQKFTKTMIEQIDTLSIIASEFSSFAKISHDKKEDINLLEVIQSSINLFSSAENISIVLKTNFEELWIEADKTQIIRAFNNLIKNAYQAIGLRDDGKIIIELLANTENCIIKIQDNGLGISPELTDKIFKPYFTTKSSGLGLGLAIVKSIIIDMGGQITYVSDAGVGTTFTITLPLKKNS